MEKSLKRPNSNCRRSQKQDPNRIGRCFTSLSQVAYSLSLTQRPLFYSIFIFCCGKFIRACWFVGSDNFNGNSVFWWYPLHVNRVFVNTMKRTMPWSDDDDDGDSDESSSSHSDSEQHDTETGGKKKSKGNLMYQHPFLHLKISMTWRTCMLKSAWMQEKNK